MDSPEPYTDADHRGWQLVMEDRLMEALAALSTSVARHPQAAWLLNNRAICHLALGEVEAALADARRLVALEPANAIGHLQAGVALWWLGRDAEAIDAWRGGLDAVYTDDGRGLEAPAMLLFAAARLRDRALEREALALLRKRWRPKLAQAWPGAIAGYLLGKLDERTFLEGQTFLNPILEARRQCRAHFWGAVQHLRAGATGEYGAHLRLVPRAVGDPRLRATLMLEEEYWLTGIELRCALLGASTAMGTYDRGYGDEEGGDRAADGGRARAAAAPAEGRAGTDPAAHPRADPAEGG